MSYKLQEPSIGKAKEDFITEYNRNQGLKISEGTDIYTVDDLTLKGNFVFALEPNEIMSEVEGEIDVPDYEIIEEEVINPETGETEIIKKQVPVMIDKEIEVPEYDEKGNIIGYHTEIIKVQSHHKETVILYKPIVNPNYEQEQYNRREREFNKAFFNTSLGYIRRTVTMADGSKKDFLSDLVLSIKAGLEQGLDVKILTYDKPPFDRDIEDWTIYQHTVSATPQFIMECLMQTANDFLPINEEE